MTLSGPTHGVKVMSTNTGFNLGGIVPNHRRLAEYITPATGPVTKPSTMLRRRI